MAGLPVDVAGMTVNRLCASGLAAVLDASRAVQCEQGELFVAGGVESMSRGPFVIAKSERAYGRHFAAYDSTLGSRFPNQVVVKQYGDHAMYETAEEIAKEIRRRLSRVFPQLAESKLAKHTACLRPVTPDWLPVLGLSLIHI